MKNVEEKFKSNKKTLNEYNEKFGELKEFSDILFGLVGHKNPNITIKISVGILGDNHTFESYLSSEVEEPRCVLSRWDKEPQFLISTPTTGILSINLGGVSNLEIKNNENGVMKMSDIYFMYNREIDYHMSIIIMKC